MLSVWPERSESGRKRLKTARILLFRLPSWDLILTLPPTYPSFRAAVSDHAATLVAGSGGLSNCKNQPGQVLNGHGAEKPSKCRSRLRGGKQPYSGRCTDSGRGRDRRHHELGARRMTCSPQCPRASSMKKIFQDRRCARTLAHGYPADHPFEEVDPLGIVHTAAIPATFEDARGPR